MKREDMNLRVLVVNADDLGFSADMNAAIEAGHRMGRITNASLMVDGAAIGEAIEIAGRNPGLGVGLHLDLCPVVGLYDRPYAQMREGLRLPEMLDKVRTETERQIRKFKGFGLSFTHLDGHRHFHALPEVFELVVEVASAHGLKSIRLTKDWILPRTPSVYWTDEFFEAALGLVRKHGIVIPDHFVYGTGEYSVDSFKPGVSELMVHVGQQEVAYRNELDRLSSDDIWGPIHRADIQLSSYPALAERLNGCASA